MRGFSGPLFCAPAGPRAFQLPAPPDRSAPGKPSPSSSDPNRERCATSGITSASPVAGDVEAVIDPEVDDAFDGRGGAPQKEPLPVLPVPPAHLFHRRRLSLSMRKRWREKQREKKMAA
jgi:hypothetical protein